MDSIRILGVMSGSSLDGVDLGIVRFDWKEDVIASWEVLATREVPYDDEWQSALEKVAHQSAFAFNSLHARLGDHLGHLCANFIKDSGIQPDYIASHGHTVMHTPVHGYTVQIGNPAIMAARASVPVIADFRSLDVAHGGQGAPLSPIVEKYLLPGRGFYLNLGGIANLSAHYRDDITAWDICPGNQLLNRLANQKGMPYDSNGDLARQGNIDRELLNDLSSVMALPLHKPYALDNSFVLRSYVPLLRDSDASVEDKLRTTVEYIARSAAVQAEDVRERLPDINASVLVTGGSAHNGFLVERLKANLQKTGIEVVIPSSRMIDFKEAVLMALCGALRIRRIPNAISTVTGASRDTVNGCIYRA